MPDNGNGQSGDYGFSPFASQGFAQNYSMESAMGSQGDLSGTLRSFRDSLAFSFQTLNLTLSSLANSVNTVGSKLTSGAGGVMDAALPTPHAYIPSGNQGVFRGSMSGHYAQWASERDFVGLVNARRTYNTNPLDFFQHRDQDVSYRLSNGVTQFGGEFAKDFTSSMLGDALAAKLLPHSGMLMRLGASIPIGMAISAGVGLWADPVMEYAQRHNENTAQLQRMSSRFLGRQFSTREALRATGGIERLAFRESQNSTFLDNRLNLTDYMDLANMGLQAHMFEGSSPDQLVKQIENAGKVVKFLTGVMGSKDIQETMQLVKQMKDMGVNLFHDPQYATKLGLDAFKYGKSLGISSDQLMNSAANISAGAFGQYGLPAFVGMSSSMRNLAYVRELERRGVLTPADIAAGGGIESITQRTLGFQAAMTRGAVGQVMMASGWDGGRGFNYNTFNQNGQNGFFGRVGAASQAIFSRGFGSIASFMMNQSNIMASMEKNGGLERYLQQVLEQGLMNLPGMQENGPVEDKVNIAAVYVKQIAQGVGASIDDATAKAIANKVVRPAMMQAVEDQAAQAQTLGYLSLMSERNSVGRYFDAKAESWDRFKSRMYENLIATPARAIADTLTDKLNFAYDSANYNSRNPLTGKVFSNFRAARRFLDSEYSDEAPNNGLDADTYMDAYSASYRHGAGLGHLAYRLRGTAFFGRMHGGNELEDYISTNRAASYAKSWLYAQKSNGNLLEELARGSGVIQNYNLSEINELLDSLPDDNDASTATDVGARILQRYGNTAEQSQRVYNQLTGSKGFDASEARSLLFDIYGGTERWTPDMIFEKLADQSEAISGLTAKMNAANTGTGVGNITTDQYRALAAMVIANDNGIYDPTSKTGVTSRITQAAITGNFEYAGQLGGAALKSRGKMSGADMYAQAEGIRALALRGDDLNERLDKLGVTPEMLDMMDLEKDLPMLSKVIEQRLSGDTIDNAQLGELMKGSSATARGLANKLANMNDSDLLRAIGTEGIAAKNDLMKLGVGYVANGEDASVSSVVRRMGETLSGGAVRMSTQNMQQGLRYLGINVDQATAQGLLTGSAKDFTDYLIENAGTTQDGRLIQNRIRELNNMSTDALQKQYGKGVGTVNGEYDRAEAIRNIIGSEITGTAAESKSSTADAMKNAETRVDTIVETNAAKPFAYVAIVANGADEARKLVDKNTTDTKPPTVANTKDTSAHNTKTTGQSWAQSY